MDEKINDRQTLYAYSCVYVRVRVRVRVSVIHEHNVRVCVSHVRFEKKNGNLHLQLRS